MTSHEYQVVSRRTIWLRANVTLGYRWTLTWERLTDRRSEYAKTTFRVLALRWDPSCLTQTKMLPHPDVEVLNKWTEKSPTGGYICFLIFRFCNIFCSDEVWQQFCLDDNSYTSFSNTWWLTKALQSYETSNCKLHKSPSVTCLQMERFIFGRGCSWRCKLRSHVRLSIFLFGKSSRF